MNGQSYPAGTLTARGHSFEIFTNDEGKWFAPYKGSRVYAASREDLRKALMRATKQAAAKVEVPFIQVGQDWGRKIINRRGTATGMHSSNRNILVTWEGGSKEQLDRYGSTTILRGDADADEWLRLHNAVKTAEAELAEFVKANTLDLRDTVQAELNKQMGEDPDGE